jgi:hypothetical protein
MFSSYLGTLFNYPSTEPKFSAQMILDYDKHFNSVIMDIEFGGGGGSCCKLQFRIDIEKNNIKSGKTKLRKMCKLLRELRNGERTYVAFTGDPLFFLSPAFEIQCRYGEYIIRNNRDLITQSKESFEIRSTNIVDNMIEEFEKICETM